MYLHLGKVTHLIKRVITIFQAFTSTPGHVMTLKIVEMTTDFYMTVKDGPFIDSPYILKSTLYDRYNTPFANPVLITESDSINIRVTDASRLGIAYIYF